jgi:hypothetical protein
MQHLQFTVDGQFNDVQLLGLQRMKIKVAAAGHCQQRRRVEQVDSWPREVARACLKQRWGEQEGLGGRGGGRGEGGRGERGGEGGRGRGEEGTVGHSDARLTP